MTRLCFKSVLHSGRVEGLSEGDEGVLRLGMEVERDHEFLSTVDMASFVSWDCVRSRNDDHTRRESVTHSLTR